MTYISNEHTANKPGGHNCAWRSDHSAHGVAVDSCSEDIGGHFWVGNDEYVNMVNFCPLCGTKAPTPLVYTPHPAERW